MPVLIQDARYVVRDAARVERDADVWIEGRRIRAVGKNLAPTAGGRGDLTVIDARGQALIPGLVNAHTHLYQCLLRGLRDDLPLEGWLQAVVFPFLKVSRAAYPDWEVMAAAARLGCAEMLKNGTTSFIDMEGSCEAAWAAWQEVGIRGVLAIVFSDQRVPDDVRLPLAAVQARVTEQLELGLAAAHGSTTLAFMLAPATPLMCSRPLLEWAADMAENYDVAIHTHACETACEVADAKRATGLSPIQLLDAAGALTCRSSLAHCVHIGHDDLELIAARGAIPVHCPKSNMKLGSGTAPIPQMLAHGLRVALANDGPASNDLLDMFEEMRTAALLHKVQGGAGALLAETVFRMATEYGAAACGIEAGTIDPGKLADLALIDLNQPHLTPDHDIVPLLVYCGRGSDVRTVIVDGRVVVCDRHLVLADEDEIIREARELGVRRYEQIGRMQGAKP
jgi:5-methylthioadenosine/S-adenosylhomocysteine deaminase